MEKHPLESRTPTERSTSRAFLPTPKTDAQPPQAEKRCSKCLSIVSRGHSHSCTPGTRHLNLKTLVLSDPLGAEQIAAAVIARKEASPRGTVRLSQGNGGKQLPVTPGMLEFLFNTK